MVSDTFEFLIQFVLECRNGSAPTAHVRVIDHVEKSGISMSRFVDPSQTRAKQKHAWQEPTLVFVALAMLHRMSTQL